MITGLVWNSLFLGISFTRHTSLFSMVMCLSNLISQASLLFKVAFGVRNIFDGHHVFLCVNEVTEQCYSQSGNNSLKCVVTTFPFFLDPQAGKSFFISFIDSLSISICSFPNPQSIRVAVSASCLQFVSFYGFFSVLISLSTGVIRFSTRKSLASLSIHSKDTL